MNSTRLRLALDSGAFEIAPEGRIAVIGAQRGDDLSDLPKERVEVIQRHFPDHSYFVKQGFDTATEVGGPYVAAMVRLPRAKAEARAAMAAALAATNGPLVVDGQKTDGVDSYLKDLRRRGDVGEVISKAHGKLFVVNGASLGDWLAAEPGLVEGRFHTGAGVFSADGVDPGSRALAEALPPRLKGRVVDLGAGWGYLADAALQREGVTSVELVEADPPALVAARQNITDERATFHWADALAFHPKAAVDHVVMNPPFHQGRAADPRLGQEFIRAAAAMLEPKGHLWLVANRHLPYESVLEDTFRSVQPLAQTPSFKLFQATSPKRSRKG
ncbi:MAG: class I SAM-dependent methyltransferase [Boseongicola sp.]|nr:class I SAM-dependent methyltransferase [Boseongicola sp.]